MTVITIGRDINSDIVVNDPKVARHHLQLCCEDGQFRLQNIDAAGNTFVNNRQITDTGTLQRGDILRIGDTELPWLSYFPDEADADATTRNNIFRITAAVITVAAIIAIAVWFFAQERQSANFHELMESQMDTTYYY